MAILCFQKKFSHNSINLGLVSEFGRWVSQVEPQIFALIF